MERYLIPIAPYALLAAMLVVCLYGFLTQSGEIRRLKARLRSQPQPDAQPILEVQQQLDEIRERLRDAELDARTAPSLASVRPSLNLSKRSQAIRLSRKGEQTEIIATMLSMPRKEVELLLKVHGLLLNNVPNSGS